MSKSQASPSSSAAIREGLLLGMESKDRIEPIGRDAASPPVTIIGFGSQEGAPAMTAPYTDQMAPRLLSDHFDRDAARDLGITSYPAIIKPANPRQGKDDVRNQLNEEHGVRNWDNVWEVYQQHYVAVAHSILQEPASKPFGIGGDHSMGASTLRGTAFSYGIRDICDGKIKVSAEFQAEIARAREEFVKNPSTESLTALGTKLDAALEKDPELMAQWQHSMRTVGVVWFDAHGDINSPAIPTAEAGAASDKATVEFDARHNLTNFASPSVSGNIHGMPVAIAMGFGPRPMVNFGSRNANIWPGNITFIAIRDLDDIEGNAIEHLKAVGLTVHTPQDLREKGMIEYRNSVAALIDKGANRVVIEHDVDGANAARYPATGTPVGPGSQRNQAPGPSQWVVRQAVRNLLLEFGQAIVSIDVAEGAARHKEGEAPAHVLKSKVSAQDADETSHSTMQIACSFLGLNREQKQSVFPGALKIDRESHSQQKIKSSGFENKLKEEGEFIPLRPKEPALSREV